MANRDQPVNRRGSKLLLIEKRDQVCSTDTTPGLGNRFCAGLVVKLHLHDSGNLVLRSAVFGKHVTYWESFKFPIDTLLPNQNFTMNTNLVSSKSQTNYSSGYYNFYFDDDNILLLQSETENQRHNNIQQNQILFAEKKQTVFWGSSLEEAYNRVSFGTQGVIRISKISGRLFMQQRRNTQQLVQNTKRYNV
ncbi:hypothetical protein F8388_019438 [Cannabis sativa]|uniref:Bulb-type lectin domain-containing protein n=1 Tax=Cannabis sativa TaxID=3483 RepID=A0A7J6FI56_CANSA|nr:hypothetical protein F8388_019438 [Cannabis sativa]